MEKINPNKAVGIDNHSRRFLRDGAKVLAKSITELFNLLIACKIANLKPLYKKGPKLEPKNYRPISLLPIVSKNFAGIIYSCYDMTSCSIQRIRINMF